MFPCDRSLVCMESRHILLEFFRHIRFICDKGPLATDTSLTNHLFRKLSSHYMERNATVICHNVRT